MAIVALPRIQIPSTLSGKGPEYFFMRESYIIAQLRNYVNKRESKLVKARAKQVIKQQTSNN
jgi:hypothetical protein